MKTLLIAVVAMIGGATLGFFLCWAVHRLARGNHTPARRMAATEKRKIGTMDKVLVLEGVILVAYTVAALVALLCVHLEGKSVRRLWKPILLFPLFMLPMGFMAVAAAIHPRVAWKPIVHRRASTIDDVLKS